MAKKESTVLEPPVKHDSKHHHGLKGGEPQYEEPLPEAPPEEGDPQKEESAAPEPSAIVTPAVPVVTPFVGSLPPVLGKTPTSVAMLQRNIPGTKGSHFTGPVVSGPPPGAPFPTSASSGARQVAGAGICSLSLLIDSSMSNFNIPIAFPPGSILYAWQSVTFTAFPVGPIVFTMGSTSGATDIFAGGAFGAALVATDGNVTGCLPLWNATSPQVPFQGWLNVTANGAGSGQGLLTLFYIRLPQPWN